MSSPTSEQLTALASANDIFAITPSDSTVITRAIKALLVTADGTLSVKGISTTAVSLGTVVAGQIIPFMPRMVMATGTTATVVGLA